MKNKPLRILLIEDNPVDVLLVRAFLEQGLEHKILLKHAGRLSEGLRLLETQTFDVILLDLLLPDSADLNTFREVFSRAGHVPIVVLSGVKEEADALAAMRMGAQDYLVKGKTDGHLLCRSLQFAIERAARLKQYQAERAAIAEELAEIQDGFATLTPRERNVLEQIAEGKSLKQIALALGTSYNTVKNQRSSIQKKLKADSGEELVRMLMIVRFGTEPPPAPPAEPS